MRKKQKKMTKMMPKIVVLLVIIALIISIIKLNSTKASTDIVEITDVEIATKSDTTFVDSVKFEDGKIKSNVEFHKVGDYLTYNVTITNKEDKNFVLKTITDNNGSENLAYSYSGYEGAKLEANKAATFNITITYAKEVDLDKREQNNLVQLTLTFEDEEGNEQEQEVIVDLDGEKEEPTEEQTDVTPEESKEENKITPSKEETPKTGDKVGIYVAIAIVAVLVFIIITRRQVLVNKKTRKRNGHGKHGKKILGLILAIALVVPAFTNISKAATTSTLNTTIDTSIKFMDKLVVTYEVNGEKKNKVVGFNEALGELGEPTKEGYEFKGWQLEDGTPVTAETKVIKDITLTPIFEELAKTSEITINVEDENKRDIVKYVTLTAVNTNIEDDKVQLQYSLDNGDTWTDYNAEIAVEKNGTIKARAIVKDDNSVIGETEKEITTVIEDVATFKPGKEVNYTMMKLAGAGDITLTELSIPLLERPVEFSIYMDENGGEYFEEQTQAILKATSEQYEAVKGTLTEANIVSTEDSLKPIYMWYENNTIYYYTEAEAMLLNEDASYMFSYFMAVSQFDVSNFYTNKTKDMSFIFDYLCSLQELDLSSFDTRNVTNMKGMFFCDVYLRQLDLGKFNTSNVTDMSLMFLQCQSLQSLNVSNFDTSNVTSMDEMFVYCASLQGLDISNFDTSNVTDMYGMFTYCVSLNELDVSNFDTSKVTNMWGMFAVCQNLETIYASENFKTENVEDSENMFVNSLNVIGGNGTVYTEEHTDKEYAVIDKPETPGYFTDVINYLKCIIKLDGQVVGKKVELLKNDSKLLTVESTEDVDVTAEDNNVITLVDNGRLDVLGPGTAKITVTGKETGKTKTLTIIVKKSFTVTYDKNGEDAEVITIVEPQIFNEGERIYLEYNLFSRPGYTFNGWNTKADGSGTSYSEGQSVTTFADADDDGKVTLYAQWTGNTYTVYFQNNGGSGSMSNQTMTYGTPTNLIANTFTRNGYVFDGWKNYNEPEKIYVDGEEVLNLTTTDNGTVYLYAQWKQLSYTVVFDKNAEDATGTMTNQTIGINVSANIKGNSFSREGYTFKGWNTAADGSGNSYTNYQLVTNLSTTDGDVVTLYAQWKVNTYTIVFYKNANNANGTMDNQTMTWGVAANLTTNTFTREGYRFVGWNTNADGSEINYTDGQLVENLTTQNAGTIRLYAQWRIDYTVVFDKNDNNAIGSMDSQPMTGGISTNLSLNTFTKEGYIFYCWNTAADGSGKDYSDGQSVKDLATEDGETVTLYAMWSNAVLGTYVDIGTNILDRTNITLKDGTHPLADWRVFSQSSSGTWLVLAAYMPNSAFDLTSVGLKVSPSHPEDCGLSGTSSLPEGATNSNWINLIAGSNVYDDNNNLINNQIRVVGAFSLSNWIDSWNDKHPESKLAATFDSARNGWKIYDLKQDKSQYVVHLSNDTLYFSNKLKCVWLTTKSASSNNSVTDYYSTVDSRNEISPEASSSESVGFRPLVFIPSAVSFDKSEEVWKIEKQSAQVISSEITITVANELQLEESKEVTLSAINTDIENNEVKLQYSLDNGNTWNDYTEPIIVTYNGIIKARSVIIANGLVIGEAEKNITTVIEDTSSKFKSGKDVNTAIMKLAGAQGEMSWMTADLEVIQEDIDSMDSTITLEAPSKNGEVYYDETITEIGKATEEQYNAVKNSLTVDNIVSTSTSEKPVYVWIDNNKVYFYSEADKIYLNEDASYMFGYFGAMEKIDLTGIDTSKTINMKGLFVFDNELRTMNISSMDTRNVTNMSFMFSGPSVASLDLSGFNTSKVTDMSFMFGDPYLADLNLSSFDTRNVTHMVAMFNECNSLTELDISSFDTRNVTHMGGMFVGMMQLEKIYVGDKFVTSNVVNSTNMFTLYTYTGQHPLRGGNGTAYSTAHIDKEYARIDKPETPGYFTDIADKP